MVSTSKSPKLSSPLVRVVRDSTDDVLTIQTANPDLILWDRTRIRHRWPTAQEAPFLFLTFVAWAAAKRRQLIDPQAVTWEVWEQDVLDLDDVKADDDDAASGDAGSPTQPGPVPG